MIEVLNVEEDAFIRTEGHILYASLGHGSALNNAKRDAAYESDCSIYFGDELIHQGKCHFKIKKSQDGTPIVVFKVDDANLGFSKEAKRIELKVQTEMFQE